MSYSIPTLKKAGVRIKLLEMGKGCLEHFLILHQSKDISETYFFFSLYVGPLVRSGTLNSKTEGSILGHVSDTKVPTPLNHERIGLRLLDILLLTPRQMYIIESNAACRLRNTKLIPSSYASIPINN